MKKADIEVEYVQHCGSDLSVVNAARVSFHKISTEMSGGDEKLIKYLAKHKHTSPFNHSFITLRVKAPIFVARQLVKHKFMPWNEVSRRYVDDEPEFYSPRDWRLKADNVKQGSSSETTRYFIDHHVEDMLDLYLSMMEEGIAPEMARMVLPQNMMTEWWWSGTLGAYADMLKLRLDPHAQYESRIVAEKAREIIEPLFPVSIKALLES
jgi:thymidylate synthase (FAD)